MKYLCLSVYLLFLLFVPGLTSSARIILYSDNNLYANTSPYPFSPVGDADTLCGTIQTSVIPSISCSSTIPFLGYTTRQIADLASTYGFPSSAPVVGPTGTAIGLWSTVATGGTISNSMFTAGVIDTSGVEFFSGSTTSGTSTSFFNCEDFSTDSDTRVMRTGWSSFTSTSWKSAGTTGCDTLSLRFICTCVETTSSPTKAPTLIIPTSKSPTTASPTTKTPTQFPTSLTTQKVTFYSSSVSYPISSWSTVGAADSLCGTIRTSNYPSLTCSSSVAFLGYTTRPVNTLPGLLGFSSSSQVIGPTGIEIASSWNVLFTASTSNFLTNSLITAGVLNPTSTYATGSDPLGNVERNCVDWTSTGTPFMNSGAAGDLNDYWIDRDANIDSCSSSKNFVCACIGQTPSPTQNPTTSKPTTAKPTSDPTKNPTRKPTTGTPTKTPTTPIPSNNPTLSPQINRQRGEVVYMLRRGSLVQVQGVSTAANISYSVIDPGEVNPPTNLTLQSTTGAVLVPIKWVSVVYRKFVPSTNTTVTDTISQCNPIANPVQGTTPNGFNGLRTCPSIRRCDNCTVELNPGGVGGVIWSTPRACICSYEVAIREDVADLPLTTTSQLQTIKLVAEPVNPTSPVDEQFIIGELKCNSFIDREINCQFLRQIPGYVPQCQSQPIDCFNSSLGYAFGGFFNQNPKFQYSLPRANWTTAHYQGIASVLNNKTYSRGGELIDPYVPSTQTDYYWFANVTSLDVLTKPVSAVDFSYVPEISQAEPYSYQAGILPGPETEYSTYPFNIQVNTCISSLEIGSTTGCLGLIWEGLNLLQWRQPGYIEYLPIQEGEVAYSLDITTTYNFSGVQVYNLAGELCGQVLRPLESSSVRISCVTSTNNTITTGGYLQVRYLGASNFWDIPGEKLTSSLPTLKDALVSWGVVSSLYSTSEYINLLYGMAYAFFNLGILLVDISASFPHISSRPGLFVYSSTYSLNYGVVTNQTDELSIQRDIVANLILNNNTYPRNYALEARVLQQGYSSSPVNYSSPEDLDYLYRFWGTWLSNRRCSEDTQCRTFGVGRCVFAETGLPKQFWYNGEPDPSYDIPAGVQEGGCLVYSSWEQGYYDSYLFGATCKSGYGPLSIDQWGKILQYNDTVAGVVPGEFPFNQAITSASQFESILACKFPVGKDPLNAPFVDFNICGGHGVVGYSTTIGEEITLPFYIFQQYYLTPQCTGIGYKGDYYSLNSTLDIFNLQYVSGTSIISIINDVVYVNFAPCLFSSTQELPTGGLLSCSGEGEDTSVLTCYNPYLFSTSSKSFSLGRLTAWSPWAAFFNI